MFKKLLKAALPALFLFSFANANDQIVDKTTKISMNILMFWSFFKKNKPYD